MQNGEGDGEGDGDGVGLGVCADAVASTGATGVEVEAEARVEVGSGTAAGVAWVTAGASFAVRAWCDGVGTARGSGATGPCAWTGTTVWR